MPTLLEKIEANAAKRLTLPPNRLPGQELARFKSFLKVETHRLKILHRSGAGGREICQARAGVLDALLRHLFVAVRAQVAPPKSGAVPVALVAIGGFGRQELNPQSDLDIMLLHDGEAAPHSRHRPYLTALAEGTLHPLFDLGLRVGHSVRNLNDCVKVANSDMQSKTSLIEARLITGDADLFDRLQRTVLAKCVQGYEDDYIAARLQDQASRRAKYGDSACMQEPNIKNGCGGLRDYQNLLWMAFFKYRIGSLAELEARALLTPAERRQLEQAYDFLLRVRTDLHYQTGRAVDVLLKGLQPVIGWNLGCAERSPLRRLERFMRQVYTHMRHVYLLTRTLEQRLALQKKPSRLDALRGFFSGRGRQAGRQVVDGFLLEPGEIRPASTRVFRDQPRRLMRVFLHAQQRGLKLHPDLAALLRQELPLVDRAFLAEPHVRETFLEILNQRGNVAPVLRAMHEVGLLGKYVPEFGKLTCLVQHEFFHRYTADEHTLVCLEMLDAVWVAQQPPFHRFKALFQKIERPYVLYLALLLHDAGKAAQARTHADQSSKLAAQAGRRLGLDASVLQPLRLLVEHHLAMIQVSQRRDLDDPAVARSFAQLVGSLENLNLLTLHTFADSLGTSASQWNDFKEALLWSLYHQTAQVLSGASGHTALEEQRRDTVLREVRRLMPKHYAEDELQAHLAHLPPRYVQIQSTPAVLADVVLVHRFLQLQAAVEERALEPVVAWSNLPDRGYAVLRVCTWDRAGLFSKIAGSLTAADLNILSAQIFSRTDGIILDTFYVSHALTGKLPSREERARFEEHLRGALLGQLDLAALLATRRLGKPPYSYLEGERLPTVIRVDHTSSETRTVMELETEDRVGLLFHIVNALSELGLDISTAKVCTEKGAAIDTFYLSEIAGGKITAPDRLRAIEERLRAAVRLLE